MPYPIKPLPHPSDIEEGPPPPPEQLQKKTQEAPAPAPEKWPSIRQRVRERVFPTIPDRPTFKQFAKDNWLDIATQLLCVVASFMIYQYAQPLMARRFPVYPDMHRTAFGIKYGKPFQREYISTIVSAVLSFAVPVAIIGALGFWKARSFEDTNAAITGLGYALSTATLFQAFIKWTIGGLRPHFLNVCMPPMVRSEVAELGALWHTPDICTGNKHVVQEAQMSFPSGHSVAAFAGFGFLAFYINAKFGIFASRSPHWQLILFVIPLLFAIIIAGSKVRDGWHHPEDVIRGALIGSAFALMAFKMIYPGFGSN